VVVFGVVGGGAYAATAGGAKSHARARGSAFCGGGTCVTGFVPSFTLSPGQSRDVAHQGALTFTAVCNSNGTAEYDATTTMAGSELDFGPQIRNWGPGTTKAWGTKSDFEGNFNTGAMIAPDGSAILTGSIILSGTNNASFSGKCVFGGMITTNQGV
jgi:hypothetical protein